jgi:hypothetical protein
MPVCISRASANAVHLLCICRNWPAGHVVMSHQQQVGAVLCQRQVTRVSDIIPPIKGGPCIAHLQPFQTAVIAPAILSTRAAFRTRKA